MALTLDTERISEFCRKWGVAEFSLFGSVTREDFGPDSDVDALVDFEADCNINLFDLMDMEEELVDIFGHPVDLIDKQGLRNPYRRHEILTTSEIIYAG
ncbi:MAG: nucleotidyltransferase family protein [Candidatus Hydrogenedentes bacterium]|nr:nucleotidyltransferase family protein [Candidatus Hydrogenedentota bacterium]